MLRERAIKTWSVTRAVMVSSFREAEHCGTVEGASMRLGVGRVLSDLGVDPKAPSKLVMHTDSFAHSVVPNVTYNIIGSVECPRPRAPISARPLADQRSRALDRAAMPTHRFDDMRKSDAYTARYAFQSRQEWQEEVSFRQQRIGYADTQVAQANARVEVIRKKRADTETHIEITKRRLEVLKKRRELFTDRLEKYEKRDTRLTVEMQGLEAEIGRQTREKAKHKTLLDKAMGHEEAVKTLPQTVPCSSDSESGARRAKCAKPGVGSNEYENM